MITRTRFAGWNDYPVYHARTYAEYQAVGQWMAENQVKKFLVSSGGSGYTFQVKSNIEWFMLKWGS
jgi:hypothetical protein